MVHEEMIALGDSLRKRRKELNISLKEVENSTSIRIGYLEAIEEGEMSKLISPVYAQGFVRQYATYLGIDGLSIVREYPSLFAPPKAQEFAYGIGTMEQRGSPGSSAKWFPNLLWIGLSAVVVAGAWYLMKYLEVI